MGGGHSDKQCSDATRQQPAGGAYHHTLASLFALSYPLINRPHLTLAPGCQIY